MLRRTGPANRVANVRAVTLRRVSAVMAASALLAGAFTAAARAETSTGGIYVTTLPGAADIWLDGTYVGRSPVLIDGLPVGHHAVTITKTGWTVNEVDVSVDAGTIAMASERLDAGPHPRSRDQGTGALVVRGMPPGATLEIDGAPLATPPAQPLALAAGSHRLTLLDRHARTSRTISILAQTTTAIVLADAPAASDNVAPAGRSVVAPVEQYLPSDAVVLEGTKIVVRYGGHVVVARLGDPRVRFDDGTIVYAGAAEQIDGKLYLPLDLLEKLSGSASK